MESTDAVLKAGMLCTRVNHVGTAQLPDSAQTEKVGVSHDVEQYSLGYSDKAKNGIVDDFVVSHCGFVLK